MKTNNIARRLSLTAAAFAITSTILIGCRRSTEELVGGDAISAESVDESSAHDSAASKVASLIDALHSQRWSSETAALCVAAKAGWDALTPSQRLEVSGDYASPEYFGLETGDASRDDPLNGELDGDREILVVSFGTSYNDVRVEDIGGLERAVSASSAADGWAVRRAFTSQIIINRLYARDGLKVDNLEQGLSRAARDGVKELVLLPTLLTAGSEYDEIVATAERYRSQFESLRIAEPLLGRSVDASEARRLRAATLTALVESAACDVGASYDPTSDAIVLLGHGASHAAKVAYLKSQETVNELGFSNVFIGTVEGSPESTRLEETLDRVAEGGFRRVVLRPYMVVSGDHAHHDMAGAEDSWLEAFQSSGRFEAVETQIVGMGRVEAIQELYLQRLMKVLKEE